MQRILRLGILVCAFVAITNPRPIFAFASFQEAYAFHLAALPNDPLYASQPYLPLQQLPVAWNTTTGSKEVIVAIIDAGIDRTHEDLKDNIWQNQKEVSGNNKDDDKNGFIDDVYGWDFVTETNNTMPRSGGDPVANQHGTVVAGIIAAVGNNGVGVTGVSWHGRIMSLRALNEQGKGYTSDVVKALRYAADNGARVINLSFVSDTGDDAPSLQTAIDYARSKGAVVVAAAGNEALDLNASPRYPVCSQGAIGVASVAADGSQSVFTNFGSNCVALSAHGEGIASTASQGKGLEASPGYTNGWSGTSMSAPMVSGTAVLILSRSYCSSGVQVEAVLRQVAFSSFSAGVSGMGVGILDAAKAVQTAISASCIITAPTQQRSTAPIKQFFFDTRSMRSVASLHAANAPQALASGDFSGTGAKDIVLAYNERNTSSKVIRYGQDLQIKKTFSGFSKSPGGVAIAAGDLLGDSKDEIVLSQGAGMRNEIRVYSSEGSLQRRFFPYGGNMTGGLTVAMCNVSGDEKKEIIVGTGRGALPRVLVFDAKGKQLWSFYAYPKSFRGGISVGCGDVIGDAESEIITAPLKGGGPHVRVFSKKGTEVTSFFSYGKGFRGGVSLSITDVDANGKSDIITVPASSGGPHVRIFSGSGVVLRQFFAYESSMSTGLAITGL